MQRNTSRCYKRVGPFVPNLFLAAVGLRYAWRAIDVLRHGADRENHILPQEEPHFGEDAK